MNRAAIHPYFGDLTRHILDCAQYQQEQLNRRVSTALQLAGLMDVFRHEFVKQGLMCTPSFELRDSPILLVYPQDRDWADDELLQAIGIDELCQQHKLLVGKVSGDYGLLCPRIYTEEVDGPGFDIYLLPKE